MLKLLWKIFTDERGASTLAVTYSFSANTLIVASQMNTNFDDVEAAVNSIEDYIGDDGITATMLGAIIRTDYGLVQHTDGSLYVDVSDTNPCLEITDGGLRAKVYGMINRTSNGLTFGRTGDVILSSNATTPTGWNDVSATYSNKFIRINATALSESGSDSHTHGGVTGAHTLTVAEMPAHTHTAIIAAASGPSVGDSGAIVAGTSNTSSAGGGGSHTHTVASADNVPAYVTLKAYQKA